MKVSVKDCLQLESFRKCIVVAGEKHMDHRVKAVSVMDAATAEEAVKCSGSSGNMVLTSFAGMKQDVKLQQETILRAGEGGHRGAGGLSQGADHAACRQGGHARS